MNAPARQARIVPSIPIKRAGTAAEIAAAICWLLSPAASYVTGTTLDVTGGR
jgi:glucose 1-dehydrogenase